MNEKLDNLDSYFSTDNLRDFLNIIGRSPSTTAAENYILSRRIKSGDESAKKEMIEKNLKLVVSIAFKNRKILSSYDKLDLIQDGVLGLIRSIETYDETKGTFSNYATYWIEQAISRGLNQNNNLIRRPYQFEFKREKYRNCLFHTDRIISLFQMTRQYVQF